jgi:hypothetical protein
MLQALRRKERAYIANITKDLSQYVDEGQGIGIDSGREKNTMIVTIEKWLLSVLLLPCSALGQALNVITMDQEPRHHLAPAKNEARFVEFEFTPEAGSVK